MNLLVRSHLLRQDAVEAAACSSKGGLLLTASMDGTARSWEPASSKSLCYYLGGSLGMALASALVQRRSQVHQFRLCEHVNPLHPLLDEPLAPLSQFAQASGVERFTSQEQALALVYQAVREQASALAYADVFWLFTLLALGLIPLALLVRRGVACAECQPRGRCRTGRAAAP